MDKKDKIREIALKLWDLYEELVDLDATDIDDFSYAEYWRYYTMIKEGSIKLYDMVGDK